MEMLIMLGFVLFAVLSIFGAISMFKQINRLPDIEPKPKMVLFKGIDETQPVIKTKKRKPSDSRITLVAQHKKKIKDINKLEEYLEKAPADFKAKKIN